MHLLVPFAAFSSDTGRQAAAALRLPQLDALLPRLAVAARDDGDALSLSTPHERALARALGWQGSDGALPWAARAAAADGVDTGDLAWGLVTPAHWHLGTEQVSLLDPAALALDEAASRTLFDAVAPLFTGAGFAFAWGAPLRWYAAHESLSALRCASPDRVVGRNVDRWLDGGDAADLRAVRRLQAEVQMLLHTHPLNDERAARGLPPVNSFWLSGCGVAQRESGPPPQVDERLRGPALADDPAGWTAAWHALDAGPVAALGEALARGDEVRLTLCGERGAVTLVPAPRGLRARLARAFAARPRAAALLETL